MSNPIGWCDETWNPVTGCTPVSTACDNCYARAMHQRFNKEPFSKIVLHLDRLDAPLHWRKSRRIFVCSMSDLFHEKVDDAFVLMVINRMIEAPQHTYFVLTKRPERMLRYFDGIEPLPNLWLGVTAENQETADLRIPLLLQTPAAHRFVSIEPLLGPVNLEPWTCQWFKGRGIDQVFVGPETGPKRRVCNEDWIRNIIEQCRDAGVACYVKAFPVGDCETCTDSDEGRKCCCSRGYYISRDPSEWPEWARVRELR